jgi:hypothetical protein
MKEDYLWDKTGEVDAEIERLENALAVFRYVETEPPALPSKIVPFERKSPKNFFRLAFTFGACTAVAVICFGIWLQVSSNKIEIAEDLSRKTAPLIDEKIAKAPTVKEQDDSIVEKVEIPKLYDERKIIKVRKIVQPDARQNKTIARSVEGKKLTVQLTKEEKYAYDQLMLALSITSSKFKIVKDKVDGAEEKSRSRGRAVIYQE